MKRRILAPAALAAVSALALSACGAAPEENAAGGETTDFKACIVSDAGGWDDRSFNESSKEGFDRAVKEFGLQQGAAESTDKSDYAQNVDTMVQQGCNLIYGVGFNLATDLTTSAQDNPDVEYALIDSTFADASGKAVEVENGKPLLFNTAEASYLAGYLAAGMSESGKVATFGGMQIPSVSIFMDGFADGVDKYNADNNANVELLGWDKAKQEGSFSGDFDNQSQGQALTKQFIDQGADIIMPVAGPVGLGAAAAVAETDNVNLIWVDADGYETVPDYKDRMITSVMKGIANSVYDTATEAKDGNFTSEPYIGTLENEGVGLAPFHDFEGKVSDELKQKIDELKSQIVDGTIKIETENAPA